MTEFIHNAWYVAAWNQELGDGPRAVRIIDEPVVLYRKGDGEIVALSDTCPHRFAPLHRGKVIGDHIQCGYHGLQFDESGACVHNPVEKGVIPRAVRVTRYPVVMRDMLIWVWMGDADKADSALIPDFHWLGEGDQYGMTRQRSLRQPLHYQLIIDNLLDLTHGAFIHPNTLGSADLARGTTTIQQDGNRILYNRWTENAEPSAAFTTTGAAKAGEPVDFWTDMRWDAPSNFALDVGVTPTGRPRSEGGFIGSVHLLTPETSTSTVYRWQSFRSFAKDSEEISQSLDDLQEYAFSQEDEPMIRAVQESMAGRDFWEMNPLLLPGDKAAVLARRTLDRLAAQERGEPVEPELVAE